ncbi:MAG: LysM peptidoglycan-binding domain-containing protein [Xanthobacteraceae bacterium]|nr:LysM peptidoglycan-binding domain-containing protein [Xanthobacteraceae bacterium]
MFRAARGPHRLQEFRNLELDAASHAANDCAEEEHQDAADAKRPMELDAASLVLRRSRPHDPESSMSRSRACAFTVAAAAAFLGAQIAATAAQQAPCGDRVEVQTGDTLSSIAKRCDVTEAKILDLNPKIQGSRDLAAGMRLDLAPPAASDAGARAREAAEGLLGRLKSYAREAGQTIEGAAETVTSSVEDFVKRNRTCTSACASSASGSTSRAWTKWRRRFPSR